MLYRNKHEHNVRRVP